jgi:hypothetical protein
MSGICGLLMESMVDSSASRPLAGSSLFGPRSGMFLTPVGGLGVPEVAELKLALRGRGNEAIPRHDREPRPDIHTGRSLILLQ